MTAAQLDLHDGTTHVCGVALVGPKYPTPEEGGWTTCKEAEWQHLGDDADTEAYSDYLDAGGQREFEDWRGERCTTCSGRHDGPEKTHRPTFGTEPIPSGCVVPIISLFSPGRSSQVSGPDVPTVDMP